MSAYTWLALWLSLLSTCSWCVVSAYTWLSLWLSLLSTCSWCVVRAYLDWLYGSLSSPPVAVCGERIHLIGSMTLSPLHLYLVCERTGAVVLWQPSHHPSGCCTLVVVEEKLNPPPPPTPLDCKALWVYNYTIKRYINASFIHNWEIICRWQGKPTKTLKLLVNFVGNV